jgi:hypothetical protein
MGKKMEQGWRGKLTALEAGGHEVASAEIYQIKIAARQRGEGEVVGLGDRDGLAARWTRE